MNFIQTILTDIFTTVYRYTGFGLIFGILFITAMPVIREKGIKNFIKEQYCRMRSDKYYRRQFIFAVYIFMILARTLICRSLWQNTLANVIGEWWMFTSKGEINSDGIANVILFIPMTFLGFSAFRSKNRSFVSYLQKSLKYSFLFSCSIEFLQMFLRLGSFQLSDIFQNTLGGLIGIVIYYICLKIKRTVRWHHNENGM